MFFLELRTLGDLTPAWVRTPARRAALALMATGPTARPAASSSQTVPRGFREAAAAAAAAASAAGLSETLSQGCWRELAVKGGCLGSGDFQPGQIPGVGVGCLAVSGRLYY